MIKKQTLLILGTGASIPYGFPDGRTTMLDICEAIKGEKYDQLIERLGHRVDRSRDFAQEMIKSGLASVDSFLESRPEYIDVGKIAIAHFLIPYEMPGVLWPRKRVRNADGTRSWEKPRWYEYLFQKLKAEADTPEAFSENRLSIITFNYDRSLEHFLFTSIRNTFGLDDTVTAQVFSTIPIVHVHGMLGPFAPVVEGGRPYTNQLSLEALALAAKHLRVIHEAIDDAEWFQQARELISTQQKMCFLGFGYHPTNVRRLEIDTDIHKTIYGSVFGLTFSEIIQKNELLGGRLISANPSVVDPRHVSTYGNLDYLRHHFPLD